VGAFAAAGASQEPEQPQLSPGPWLVELAQRLHWRLGWLSWRRSFRWRLGWAEAAQEPALGPCWLSWCGSLHGALAG